MGVNSLPKILTRQRHGCDLNPDPSAPESSTLTTRLPGHPITTSGVHLAQNDSSRHLDFQKCHIPSSDNVENSHFDTPAWFRFHMYDYSLFSKCDQGHRATPYNFDKGVVTFWEHKINLPLVIRVLRFGNYTMALLSVWPMLKRWRLQQMFCLSRIYSNSVKYVPPDGSYDIRISLNSISAPSASMLGARTR